jgi:hypothetical protein
VPLRGKVRRWEKKWVDMNHIKARVTPQNASEHECRPSGPRTREALAATQVFKWIPNERQDDINFLGAASIAADSLDPRTHPLKVDGHLSLRMAFARLGLLVRVQANA